MNTLSTLRKENYSDLLPETEDYAIPDDSLFYETIEERDEPMRKSLADSLFDPIEDFPEALEYIKSRNVSLETAKKLNIVYDSVNKRICFPVRARDSVLYGFSGRSIGDQTPKIMNYGSFAKSGYILGADLWVKKRPIVLVEGLFAYARLHEEIGDLPYNIGALMGSSISDNQKSILLYEYSTVYLMLDGDAPGLSATQRAYKKIYKDFQTLVTTFPEGKNDPADLTKEEILSMLQKAKGLAVSLNNNHRKKTS